MTAKELARLMYEEIDRQASYVGEFNFPDGEGRTTCIDGDVDLTELAEVILIALAESKPT